MDDLISRQDAIDELKRISFSHWFECGKYLSEDTREIEIISSKKALEVIEALPSAQPEIVRCKNCAWWQRDWSADGKSCYYCPMVDTNTGADFYCADAEREET